MSGIVLMRYYRDRTLDYLADFGLPLRRRSLLFYERQLGGTEPAPALTYGDGGTLQRVSADDFRQLHWRGDPVVTQDAATWLRREKRWPIVASRLGTMDGFCWLEEGVAEIQFFDWQCPLPVRTLYLSRVWVYPDFRDLGIGRALLQLACTVAAELGSTSLISACVPHNQRMRHLFTMLGWTYCQQVDYLRMGRLVRFSLEPAGAPRVRTYSAAAAATRFRRYVGRVATPK